MSSSPTPPKKRGRPRKGDIGATKRGTSTPADEEPLTLPPLATPEEDWAERGHEKPAPEVLSQLYRLRDAALADAEAHRPRTRLLEAQKKAGVPEQYAPAAWFYYWRIYVRALASRYIKESGATLESVVAVTSWGEWDMAGTLVAPPSGPPLVQADGSPAQTWDAWLEAKYPDGGEHFSSLLTGLRSIAEALRPKVQDKRERAAAEAAAAKARLAAEVELARTYGNALMPRSLHLGFQRTEDRRVKQKEDREAGALVLEDAGTTEPFFLEARTNPRELVGLNMPQYRVLFGLCQMLADRGQDHKKLFPEHLHITAAEFYSAGNINTAQQKLKRDLFMAAVVLSERKIQHEVIVKDDHGSPRSLYIQREEVLHMVPEFAYDDTIAEKWQDWCRLRAKVGADNAPDWDGPLPTGYVFTLPTLMRSGDGALVFSRSVLRRLDQAAKDLGYKMHPFFVSLFLEATITRQAQQYDAFPIPGQAEPVESFRCYIDRRQVLEDYFGADALKNDPSRHQDQYKKALEVNLKAGTFLSVEPERTTTRGKQRDIVVPNPQVLPGLTSRAEGARLHAAKKDAYRNRQKRSQAKRR